MACAKPGICQYRCRCRHVYQVLPYLSTADDTEAADAAATEAVATAAVARCGSGTGCAAVAAAEPLDDVKTAALPLRLLLVPRAAPPPLTGALPLPTAAAAVAAAAAFARPSGRKPARAMIAARATPSSSSAVCPLSGSVTRRASGSTPASRAASAIDGSSRSAADATSSVGTLHTCAVGHRSGTSTFPPHHSQWTLAAMCVFVDVRVTRLHAVWMPDASVSGR